MMDTSHQDFVLHVLDTAQDLTLATIRPDGYPQAGFWAHRTGERLAHAAHLG
jgi:hypothetical protein